MADKEEQDHFQGSWGFLDKDLEHIKVRTAFWVKSEIRSDCFSIDNFLYDIEAVQTLKLKDITSMD